MDLMHILNEAQNKWEWSSFKLNNYGSNIGLIMY